MEARESENIDDEDRMFGPESVLGKYYALVEDKAMT